jgi:hypothetical protein
MTKVDYGQRILPLRNGAGPMKIAKARGVQAQLCGLLQEQPELFVALHALVEGRGDEVNREQRRMLKDWGMLTRAGGVQPEFRAVMIAGCRETPAGPVITEPFDLSDPEHAAAAQRADDQFEEVYRKIEAKSYMSLPNFKALDKEREEGKGRSYESASSLNEVRCLYGPLSSSDSPRYSRILTNILRIRALAPDSLIPHSLAKSLYLHPSTKCLLNVLASSGVSFSSASFIHSPCLPPHTESIGKSVGGHSSALRRSASNACACRPRIRL